ncbi:unnamed protein product [Paramecium primaurelia]|uniref:Uncharacterized protein n=1 Tax=Paramecium primaurelia TaxID=5886 RepID=A0A8S1KI83_PARPR|nr:unnamed protein product [Paramecium primaurelia]
MNKQLDFNPKFPQHNPFKFLYYNEVKNGFYLDNPNELYIFDEAEGWADQNGCYYQKDGAPAGWVFVSQGKFTRYDMNQRKVETGKNIYYPETIFDEEMQNEGKIQQQDQKSQKTSNQDNKNPSQYQKQNDQCQNIKSNQSSATLKEHQQHFQRFVQENNMQLHQIYFKKKNYIKGYQMDQQSGRQRVKSEDYRRDQRYIYNQNMNEFKSYNKLPQKNHSVYGKYQNINQNGRQNHHQHYSNETFKNSDHRIRSNYSSKSNYNNNYESNSRNFNNNNHSNKRNWNKSNENDRRDYQQYQNQKQYNLVKNPFIDQPLRQQYYQNQQNNYHDRRNEHNQIEYNIQSERIKIQKSNYDYQKNQNNNHSDYSNYQNKNLNVNKDGYNYRQNNNKYSKQNENNKIIQQLNLQNGNFLDQKQQYQYVLRKDNSYSQFESNQQPIFEQIRYFGQNSEVIPDKQGAPERRERKSRLNQT